MALENKAIGLYRRVLNNAVMRYWSDIQFTYTILVPRLSFTNYIYFSNNQSNYRYVILL